MAELGVVRRFYLFPVKVTQRKLAGEHAPELQQLLDELAHAFRLPLSSYGDLFIIQYLMLCRYPNGTGAKPQTIAPTKQLPWPNPLLGSKLSKHDGTEVFGLIHELAAMHHEPGELYLNSTVAAAINKLCTMPKKKKRR